MSSQSHTNLPEPPAISSYTSAAAKTLAHITCLHQQIKSAHSLCLHTQNEAEKIRKFKLKMIERKNFFQAQATEAQLNESLWNVYQRTSDESNESNEDPSKMTRIVLQEPKIVVPDLGWVTRVLDEISEDNFASFQSKIEHEKSLVESLQGMHSKYWQKLKKVEEKLAKGYAEAKSKKRYL